MYSPVVAKTMGLTVMNFVLSLGTRYFKNQKNDSLIRFSKSTRVEPIAIVDQRVTHLAYTSDVMQTLSSLFIGYYLQAVALATQVGRVNVVRLLDALNPTRDVHDAAATKLVDSISMAGLLSLESYQYALPVPNEAVGIEAFGETAYRSMSKSVTEELAKNDLPKVDGVDMGKSIKDAFQAVNLSVGKLLEVTVKDGKSEATFPIMVRLIATIVGSDILVHILGDGSRNSTMKERWHAWRAGQLDFWRDIVMASDLIEEHRRVLLKDKTGTYEEILNRRRGNAAASALSGTPSIGTASNLIILSDQSARELEAQVGGRLSSVQVRDKIFMNSYVMILAIIDAEHEQVTFYHRGIALPTQLSVKELKVANKGTGPDVAEILKAYQLGNRPPI